MTGRPRPLYVTEEEVRDLLTMGDTVDALDRAFRSFGDGLTFNAPRQRSPLAPGSFNRMAAGDARVFGMKSYAVRPGITSYHLLLYDRATLALLAVIEAQSLGQIRTGAASGVATRALAAPEASVMAIVGTGRQALAQVLGVAAVRDLKTVRVFSPTVEKREGFARMLAGRIGCEITTAASAAEAIDGADIVTAVTNSPTPVIRGEWLRAGTHVNLVGSNAAARRECDAEGVLRASIRVVDDLEQARGEAGEFIDLVAEGRLSWSDIVELPDILSGAVAPRRDASEITMFKSLGVAIEDIVAGALVYDRAVAEGLGRSL